MKREQLDGTVQDEVTLTGRKAIENQFLNAVAITDITNHDSNYIDLSSISGRKYIHVANSLNQSVTITLIINTVGLAGSIPAGSKTIAAGGFAVITVTDIGSLADALQQVKIRAACATAPTSGSISVWLEGVQQ